MDGARLCSLVHQDLGAQRREFLFKPPEPLAKRLVALLDDPRDAPAAYLLSNVALLTVPAAAAVLLFCTNHVVGCLYLVANYVLFLQRFMLTLHFTEHRRLFRKEHDRLNSVIPWLLCPFFGVPPAVYKLHHCIMHHVEDNHAPADLTSTEPYQRDSLLHFLQYWVRYWVLTWVTLPAYALRTKRTGCAVSVLSGETLYWAALLAAWRYNPVGALWAIAVPFMLSSLLLMFGNWSQHIFVDPRNPGGAYRSTYNCLACPDNAATYNDGYHIIHHVNSRLHWSELPQRFLDTVDKHGEQDALAFDGLGFFDIGLHVFLGRLDFLASRIVPCSAAQAARTQAEWVQLLRQRLQPVEQQARKES